ncbi:MAG: hypothetical protein N0E58_23250 [Candidatus Thiodiazotropha endolucinida]|nr:hypothetical protein [Candidatus Thiodiazotropha endolucinida]
MSEKLNWEEVDKDEMWCAENTQAGFIITKSDGKYSVGYVPSPGPMCSWQDELSTMEEAKESAEKCVQHVAKIRTEMGYK